VRSRDYIPLVLLAGIAGFFVVKGTQNKREIPRRVRAPKNQPVAESLSMRADTARPDSTSVVQSAAANLRPARPERDFAAIQTKIAEGAPGTYIRQMLLEQHDSLTHWPERRLEAIRVFVDRSPSVPDFSSAYPLVAERVFDEWRQAGFPLNFDFVTDSSQADITIAWFATIPSDDKDRLGTTIKTYDNEGWIVHATILISTRSRGDGTPLAADLVAGIARHEVGHALGLGHSGDRKDVMFPESTTPVISTADRATLHFLYMLPPGPTKAP
jgi:hypothetical protein